MHNADDWHEKDKPPVCLAVELRPLRAHAYTYRVHASIDTIAAVVRVALAVVALSAVTCKYTESTRVRTRTPLDTLHAWYTVSTVKM